MKTKFIFVIAGSLCCAPLSHAANIIDSIYGIGAGSFEIPDPNITDYDTFTAGSTAMAGWTVGQASIDWVHQSIWTSSNGKYSLDMNGTDFTGPDAPEVGSVYTVIPTTAGSTYLISFDVSGYLNFGNSTNPKEMDVSVEAVNISSMLTEIHREQVLFTATNNSSVTPLLLDWSTRSFTFVATEANTRISFISKVTNNTSGMILDNVSVEIVPEPGSTALLGATGLLLLSRRSRRPR